MRGGHHCRTDCESHGMLEGQYHFHANLMDSTQFKRYTRLHGALCTRIFKRFSNDSTLFDRVQERIEKRFGFRCGSADDVGTNPLGYATFNSDRNKRQTGFDLISTRRRAEGSQVMRVIDGDTLEVRESDGDTQRVRLIGINAPEMSGYGGKEECYGSNASLYLKRLLARKHVELIPQPKDNRDKFGRLLRYLHMDGGDIGLRMLTLGYAYNYPWFEHPRLKEYKAAEIEAQNEDRGLWAECK